MKNEENKQQAQKALARLKNTLQKLTHNALVPDKMKEELLGRNYFFGDDHVSLPTEFRKNLNLVED